MDDNQWHQHDIMNVVIMELHSSWKLIVLIELQLNYNFTIHATCPLTLIMNKYNEL